ncbi:MAG: hypothetical protein HC896_17335 [Bacteroidales bacterium]|nr:hypothetical protein [Bacteroidales bacterium]
MQSKMNLKNSTVSAFLCTLLPGLGLMALVHFSTSSVKTPVFNENRVYKKMLGFDKPMEYAKYFQDITVPFGQNSSGYGSHYRQRELEKALQKIRGTGQKIGTVNFRLERTWPLECQRTHPINCC